MQIHRDLFRQADFIEQSLHNLFTAFVEGAGLVILVVVVFLMNVRAAAITLLALPLSLVAAVIAMDRFGLTINTMSLGGLAIAIGELVDDAIIDVENVVRRLRENAATTGVGAPAGARGRLPRQHRDPALRRVRHRHHGAGLPAAVHPEQRRRPAAAAARVRLRRGADRLAGRRADRHAGAVLVAAAALAPDRVRHGATPDAAAQGRVRALAGPRVHGTGARCWRRRRRCWWPRSSASLAAGRSFLPEFNEGALTVSAVTMPGTSLADSNALGNALERLLLSVPEVTSTARRTGRAELDEHVQGVESAEIDVRLAMKDRPREAVLAELRQKVSLLPGTNVTIGQPISHRIDHMLSGTRANIAVKIFGDDLPTLRQLAGQVQARDGAGGRRRRPVGRSADRHPDAEGPRRSGGGRAPGLATGAVAEALQTARVGHAVGQILEGQIAFPLVVRYAHRRVNRPRVDRHDADPDAGSPPDSAVLGRDDPAGPRAELRHARERPAPDRGPEQRVRPRLRSVVNDIQARVGQNVPLPQGYHVEYGGQFESERRRRASCCGSRSASIVAIFFILSAAFGRRATGC